MSTASLLEGIPARFVAAIKERKTRPTDAQLPENAAVYPRCAESARATFALQPTRIHMDLRIVATTALLLIGSNVFMTFAWYAHLKDLNAKPWYLAVVVSWGIAFFEYMLQVPANRIGFGTLDLPQLKIMQEVITLSVFVPFSLLYMKQPLKLDFLWAGLCLAGAVYFMFRAEG